MIEQSYCTLSKCQPLLGMRKEALILYCSPKTASMYTTWSLEPLSGRPAILRLIERLQKGLPVGEFKLLIICHQDVMVERLKPLITGSATELFVSEKQSRLQALADFSSRHLDIQTLLVLPENALFVDCALSLKLRNEHHRVHAEATSAPDLPKGLTPEIYSTKALMRLAEMGLPENVSGDCLSLMQRANQLFQEDKSMQFKVHVAESRSLHPSLNNSLLPSELLLNGPTAKRISEQVLLRHKGPPRYAEEDAVFYKTIARDLSLASFTFGTPPPAEGVVPVLFTTKFTAYSGAEECFYDLIVHLDRKRFFPVVLLPAQGVLSEKLRQKGVFVEIAQSELHEMTPRTLQYIHQLIAHFKIRLVHVNVSVGMPLVLSAHHAGIPIVTHVRSMMGMSPPEEIYFSKAVITVSKLIAQDLKRSNLHPDQIMPIYDGQTFDQFKPEQFDKQQLRQEMGIPQEAKVLAHIARICDQKRQKFVVEALPAIVKREPNVLVLFVGECYAQDASYKKELQERVSQLNLEKFVRFWGFEKNIAKIHAVSDALILCTFYEPFGHCVLEAMAMNLPIIAPQEGGHTEILQDGKSAFLYNAKKIDHFAQHVSSCLNTPAEQLLQITQNSRRIIKTLDITQHVKQVAAVYDSLLL